MKYHHGAHGEYVTPVGTKITVELASNPSHLEAVDGVVEGMTRCLQTDHTVNPPTLNHEVAAPILIHGDAAFAAQGIVAEVLNLQALAGYATGGTIHIISNNQVGFTTDPSEARSTRYASDLAKGYDLPIVHVNADDVDASHRRGAPGDRLPPQVRPRRRGRPDRLPPLRPQRTGRAGVHAADEVRPDQTAPDRARALRRRSSSAQGVLTNEQIKEMQDTATARIAEAHKNVKSGEFKAKLIQRRGDPDA